jgi:hypothetical protein
VTDKIGFCTSFLAFVRELIGRENKCKKICSEVVKVDGVVGLKGTEKEREELDERKREQDEYSARKGL